MTRGNQRDVDRARAQARQAKNSKNGQKGDPNARREADAKALQEKIAKKAAMKEGGGGDAANAKNKNGAKKK